MSCANILGTSPVRGTVCVDDLATAFGTSIGASVSWLTVGATQTSSNTVTIPFLKSTDCIIWGLANYSGGAGQGPLGGTATVTNPGLATATLQLTGFVAGAAGVVANFWYIVLAGETA